MLHWPAGAARIALVVGLGGLSACTSLGLAESSGGSALANLVKYGSVTEPPIAERPPEEAPDCPPVLVAAGRAALKSGTSQVSVANVARECIERPNGAVAVKVGIEGRALLGPGSGSARFDVPVTIVLKRGETVLASRVKRVAVSIPAGQAQASFVVVEGGLIVPPGTGEFDIEIGLGGSTPAASPSRPRRTRG